MNKHIIGNSQEQDLEDLISLCKENIVDCDENLLRLAYSYCVIAHEGRLRKNGKKFYTHPLAVAHIVIEEIPLDMDAVVAALLHNVLDESDIYTYEDIIFTFGERIASIVEGITRIKFVESQHIGRPDQLDNYRKLLLTLFKDIRIILVKLADKLDNMRALSFSSLHRQKQIAQETLDIYAPFANRLGLTKTKFELEDLSFRFLYPEEYKIIEDFFEASEQERKEFIEQFINKIERRLANEPLLKRENIK